MNQRIILVVEDQPDDELLTLRALGKNAVENTVIVVRDGAEAMDYLFSSINECGTHSGRGIPDLILLDLKLPKVDGLEILKRLRADSRTRFLPIVVLTASPEEEDFILGYRLGADSVIRKPVDLTDFCRSVQQLGLYWLVAEEPVVV